MNEARVFSAVMSVHADQTRCRLTVRRRGLQVSKQYQESKAQLTPRCPQHSGIPVTSELVLTWAGSPMSKLKSSTSEPSGVCKTVAKTGEGSADPEGERIGVGSVGTTAADGAGRSSSLIVMMELVSCNVWMENVGEAKVV